MADNIDTRESEAEFDDAYYTWLQSRYDFALKEMQSSVDQGDLWPYLEARVNLLIENSKTLTPKPNLALKRNNMIDAIRRREITTDLETELDRSIRFLQVKMKHIRGENDESIAEGIPRIAVPAGTIENLEYLDNLVPFELRGLEKIKGGLVAE